MEDSKEARKEGTAATVAKSCKICSLLCLWVLPRGPCLDCSPGEAEDPWTDRSEGERESVVWQQENTAEHFGF